MIRNYQTWWAITLLSTACLSHTDAQPVEHSVEMIHRWEFDPDIESQWTFDFWSQPKAVDVAGFRSSQLQTQVTTAQTTTLQTRVGVTNRKEAFAAALERLQVRPTNQQARLALVSATVHLASSQQDVESVWNTVATEPSIRGIVESKLVEMKSPLAIELWRERVASAASGSGSVRHSQLLTALEGLAVVGDEQDRSAMEKLFLLDGTALAIKLAAAEALGAAAPAGLEPLAEQTLASGKPMCDLLAAKLLAKHTSPVSLPLLERVLDGSSSPAQLIAYRTLVNSDAQLARELADKFIEHPDNILRMEAVQVLDKYDDATSLNTQATRISDVNPTVRNRVRANLVRKAANTELRPLVDDVITFQLAGGDWQGIEQAITLAVALDEAHRTPSFLPLLDHPQPEVFIRAAWGLQMLELSPETLDNIMQRCLIVTRQLDEGEQVEFPKIAQTAFLFEAIGRHTYAPANDMLMVYVPKNDYRMVELTRASAIYALGRIWEGKNDKKLAKQLAERMLDDNPIMPEDDLVRYNSALALGRIRDPASVPELKKIYPSPREPLWEACAWSLQQLGVE